MTRPRLYLSLDPGSQITGYAVMADGERLVEGGVLRPDRTRDPAIDRLRAMKRDLLVLLEQVKPDVVVVEFTSGKVGKRHGGAGAGLAVYGIAVGMLWEVCENWAMVRRAAGRPCRVEVIPENEWTRRQTKAKRTMAIAALFPEYLAENDKGMDVADAIGLNLYMQRKEKAESCRA